MFSKKALIKMLHGSLDSRTDQCFMRKVQESPISLVTSPTGLYLIDMKDICAGDELAMFQAVISEAKVPKSGNLPNGDRLGYENNKNSIIGGTDGVSQSHSQTPKIGFHFQKFPLK